jgi:hypothetical protein
MLDLLAAISSVDPPSLLAWLILAFAASGYPLGIMLGSSCSPCCNAPCTQCTEGELPETLTVTFSGLQDQTPGPDLCLLTFSAPYGGGAVGKVTAPGGYPDTDKGPITAVNLTNGGSGYAKLGRVAPTITASGGSGTGATFSVSATSANDANGIPSWSVTGVTVTGTTSGYADGDQITFSVAAGDTEEQAAAATINTTRTAPTLSASVASDAGTGATLSVTLTQTTDYDGRAVWNVSGITATSGGGDYVVGDPVSVTVTDGQETYYSYFSASVSSVDGDGAITGVTIDYGGEYFKDSGVITGVTVDAGGTYYREDASESPYVATVTVGVTQTAPSAGTGATLTATVEDDTASANFGKITAIAITNGGTNYLAWEWRNTKCCGDYYNGLSVVVKRLNYGDGNACRYEHRMCGVGNMTSNVGRVQVLYNGPTTRPYITLQSEILSGTSSSICNTTFTAIGNVTNCSEWSGVSFSASGGSTATVSAGGEYDATYKNPGGRSCFICCKGNEPVPSEVEIDITSQDANAPGQGVYVRPVLSINSGPSNLVWGNSFFGGQLGVSADMRLCASQTSSGFFPSDCGDNCHKKCSVAVDFSPEGVSGSRYWTSNYPLGVGADCECKDTPLCNPFGNYTLCNSVNPSDCPYTVTINAPL